MELVAFGDIDRFGTNDMKISWEITTTCNFSCPYCKYSQLENTKRPSEETIYKIIDFIKNIAEERNVYRIYISAAEPTTLPNFALYMKLLSESIPNSITINFDTNLSAPVSLYKNIIDGILENNNKVNFVSSFHMGFMDVYDFFNKNEELREIYKDNDSVYVMIPNFMIDGDESYELANKFHETQGYENIIFSINNIVELEEKYDQIWSDDNWENVVNFVGIYKENDRYFYKKHKIEKPYAPNFMKHICKCYENSIYILNDGRITPCQADGIQSSMSVFDNNAIEKISNRHEVICPIKVCRCDADVPKYKISEYSKLKEWTREDIEKLEHLVI